MPVSNKISNNISDFYKEVQLEKERKAKALARKLRRMEVKLEAKTNTKDKSKHGYNGDSDGCQRSIGNNSKEYTKISGIHQGNKSANNKKGGVSRPLNKEKGEWV